MKKFLCIMLSAMLLLTAMLTATVFATAAEGAGDDATKTDNSSDSAYLEGKTAGITGVQVGKMSGLDGHLQLNFNWTAEAAGLKALWSVDLAASAIPGKTLGDLVTINGVTVTELVKQGKVARFNFYGSTMTFHIDNEAYRSELKSEQYEIVILPGFQWVTWDKDNWGNIHGLVSDQYTPVEGSLVLEPISFYVNEQDEVVVPTDGITIEPGYKETYTVGDTIDMRSLLIRINYSDGKSDVMPVLEDMVTYDFSTAGEATVTVEYDGMQASFTVMVVAPETVTETETETATETVVETETETETEPETVVESEPETVAESETLVETEPTTEPITEPTTTPTVTATETEGESDIGCQSSATVLSVLALTLAGGLAVAAKKKKED